RDEIGPMACLDGRTCPDRRDGMQRRGGVRRDGGGFKALGAARSFGRFASLRRQDLEVERRGGLFRRGRPLQGLVAFGARIDRGTWNVDRSRRRSHVLYRHLGDDSCETTARLQSAGRNMLQSSGEGQRDRADEVAGWALVFLQALAAKENRRTLQATRRRPHAARRVGGDETLAPPTQINLCDIQGKTFEVTRQSGKP